MCYLACVLVVVVSAARFGFVYRLLVDALLGLGLLISGCCIYFVWVCFWISYFGGGVELLAFRFIILVLRLDYFDLVI